MKQESLQIDSTDAPTDIFIPGNAVPLLDLPEILGTSLQERLKFENPSCWRQTSPWQALWKSPSGRVSSSQSPLVFVMYLIFAFLTLAVLHINENAKASCTDKNWHVCTGAKLTMLF